MQYDHNKDKTWIVQAWGEWLKQYSWDWFATLTFKNPLGWEDVDKRINRWIYQLKSESCSQLSYIVVADYKPAIPHSYVLLSGVNHLKPSTYKQNWCYSEGKKDGLGEIERYNAKLGASYHMGKKLVYSDASLLFSPDFKPLIYWVLACYSEEFPLPNIHD
jgi:hypothetical protein